MDSHSMITPWISGNEWQQVYDLLTSLEASQLVKAEELIATWQCRVDRLPTGVETTQCLVQAALAWCENPDSNALSLTFSSAIIRFLNLTSHVGFNKFGLSKIHEVAERFNIPARLVELRHDTTHGEMKSKESLLEGLALALQWTITNYWQWEANHKPIHFQDSKVGQQNGFSLEATEEMETTRVWLECYQYLKIYNIWGNETLAGLKVDDTDTFDHIASLWSQLTIGKPRDENSVEQGPKVKRRRKNKGLSLNTDASPDSDDIAKIKIREAIASIRNELHSLLSRRTDKKSNIAVVRTLVDEHLLLSERDFVESLLEDDEINSKLLTSIRQNATLPRNLAKSWSDILRLLSEAGLLPSLVRCLYEVSGNLNSKHQDSFSKDLATAWICDIFRALESKPSVTNNNTTPSKNKPKQKFSSKNDVKEVNCLNLNFVEYKTDPIWQSLFEHMILNPNERTSAVLPHVFKMLENSPTQSEEKKIQDMMQIFLGKKIGDSSKKAVDSEIKTLDSLLNVSQTTTGGWRLVDDIDWENIPLGLCPGQTEDKFLSDLENLEPEHESPNFKHSHLSFLQDFDLEIQAKDWLSSSNRSQKFVRFRNEVVDETVPAFYRSK